MSESIENAQIATQAVVSAGLSFSLLSSFSNLSSPQSFLMTVRQFQLILLTLLTSAYIPKNIIDFLSGMKMLSCSFKFIPFDHIPGFDKMIAWMDSELNYHKLKYFDIDSGSSFVNTFSII